MLDDERILREFKELYNMDITEPYKMGLVRKKDIIRFIVMSRYWEIYQQGKTFTAAKDILTKEYGVSYSSIEKWCYRHNMHL